MTTTNGHIRIGLFNDFEGEDTILISADINGLIELEDTFSRLASGQNIIEFSELKFLDKKYKINIKAFNDIEDLGLTKIKNEIYEWRLTRGKWNEFREKLTSMYRLGNGGQHYLDSDCKLNNDYQVIFSWNEGSYNAEFWKKYRQ